MLLIAHIVFLPPSQGSVRKNEEQTYSVSDRSSRELADQVAVEICFNHRLINFNGPESQILHSKFGGNRSPGPGEEGFKVFTIYGHGSHLGHMTNIIFINFHFLVPKCLYKIWLKWPSGF